MTTLRWGIKRSLLQYVRGSADGTVRLSGGATETPEGFQFPGEGLRFVGAVTLTAHNGMMRVVVADPALVSSSEGWAIEISDPDDADARLGFATIGTFDGHSGTGVVLTADGADLFFGPYTAGTPVDEVTVHEGAVHLSTVHQVR